VVIKVKFHGETCISTIIQDGGQLTIYGTGQNISQDKIFHTPLTTFEEAVK
jgi:hypothetical protein